MSNQATRLAKEITGYLAGGGLFNPEMANHDAVRDLLIECRDALLALVQPAVSEEAERMTFEAEAICRTWAYRSHYGLQFYPAHGGGADLWKGWLARAQSSSKGDEGKG